MGCLRIFGGRRPIDDRAVLRHRRVHHGRDGARRGSRAGGGRDGRQIGAPRGARDFAEPRLRLGRHGDAAPRGVARARRRARVGRDEIRVARIDRRFGRARAAARVEARRRARGHRAHALGDARRQDRRERAPALRRGRARGRRAQRRHHQLGRAAPRARGAARHRAALRDRHRGHRAVHRPRARRTKARRHFQKSEPQGRDGDGAQEVRGHVGPRRPRGRRPVGDRRRVQREPHDDRPRAGQDLRRVRDGRLQPAHQELHRHAGRRDRRRQGRWHHARHLARRDGARARLAPVARPARPLDAPRNPRAARSHRARARLRRAPRRAARLPRRPRPGPRDHGARPTPRHRRLRHLAQRVDVRRQADARSRRLRHGDGDGRVRVRRHRPPADGRRAARGLAVGRDERRAADAQTRRGGRRPVVLGRQHGRLAHRADDQARRVPQRRPRERRRLDQSLHDAGHRHGAHHVLVPPTPVRGARRRAADVALGRQVRPPHGRPPTAAHLVRHGDAPARPVPRARRAAPTRRPRLPPRQGLRRADRARGRPQNQGVLLRPRRGLLGRRDEARPLRAHLRGPRRQDAGHHDHPRRRARRGDARRGRGTQSAQRASPRHHRRPLARGGHRHRPARHPAQRTPHGAHRRPPSAVPRVRARAPARHRPRLPAPPRQVRHGRLRIDVSR
mmetsp:Transcript_20206/g.80658  ORF Transcript_20206/g.80658 Transcript_20206/m.80658 type:complete len:677 (+) Transcript_20206:81-2111(+)